MPLKNSAAPSAKKPGPAPPSAVSHGKRLLKKSTATKNPPAPTAAARRARRHAAAFSTLKSRQQAVERARLQVWRHLEEINGAVIKLAESGSYLAARTLFDFAGVYNLPPLENEAAPNALPAAPAGALAASSPTPEPPPSNRVEAFLKTLGLDELRDDEPEPDVAA